MRLVLKRYDAIQNLLDAHSKPARRNWVTHQKDRQPDSNGSCGKVIAPSDECDHYSADAMSRGERCKDVMPPNPSWPCVDTFLSAVQPRQQPRARQICHIVVYLMTEWDTNFTNPGVCYQYAKGGFLNLGSPHDATLGQKIRQARLDAGLNQKELGDQLGLGQHSISRYEVGARTLPLHILRDIARELNRPMSYFVSCDGDVILVKDTKLHAIVEDVQSSSEEINLLYEFWRFMRFRRTQRG
jgi:transcriptional regulator with XRE-family HTH domain